MNPDLFEQIDVLDINGFPTGVIKSREEIHSSGYWHKGVHVWIMNSKHELLLQKRSSNKDTYPNKWDVSSGGHVISGETSVAAAIRELYEEFGVKIDKSQLNYLFTTKSSYTPKYGFITNVFNDVFIVILDLSITDYILTNEISELKFLDYHALEDFQSGKFDVVPIHNEEYNMLYKLLNSTIIEKTFANEERLDILNETGAATGNSSPRSIAHQLGNWHKVVWIWILNQNSEILLAKRAKTKDIYPDKWDMSCGGHAVSGETSIEAAHRELCEELGLIFDDDMFQYLTTLKKSNVPKQGFFDNEFADIYVIRNDVPISQITFNDKETAEVQYIHYAQVKEMIIKKDESIIHDQIQFLQCIELIEQEYILPHTSALTSDEYIDVLDEYGAKTGSVATRTAVHSDGLWHRVARIWGINKNKELLIQKRSPHTEVSPNKWHMSAAGHIDADETSINAAMRELREEVGIYVDENQLKYLFTTKEAKNPKLGYLDNEFCDTYLAYLDIDDLDTLQLPESETAEVKFIPYLELKEMVNNNDSRLTSHPEHYDKLFEILDKEFGC